jgi:beta-lactamase regulating signal transducer with metallopeptidase domain
VTLLLAWVWQGLVLALAVHVALRTLRRLDAATRHALWWGTLGAVMLLPVVLAAPWPWSGNAAAAPGLSTPDVPAAPDSLLTLPAPPAMAAQAAVGVWLALTAVRFGRLVHAWRAMRRLVRESSPLDAALERRLVHVARARRAGPPVTVRLSEAARVPCAVGLGHAVVLVPPSLARALDTADLDRIVLHEYAHLLRRDDRWRLAQALLEAPLGLHPAVAWIGRQIELEREAACDDIVVALAGEGQRYAGTLVDTAWHARRAGPHVPGAPPLAPAATRAGRLLRARVERLLDADRPRRLRPAASSLAAGGALLAAAALGLATASPTIGVAARETRPGAATATRPRLPAPPGPGVLPDVLARPMSPERRQAPDRTGSGHPGAASLASGPPPAPRAARRPVPGSPGGRIVPITTTLAEPVESDPTLPALATLASTALPADHMPARVHLRTRGTTAALEASSPREDGLAAGRQQAVIGGDAFETSSPQGPGLARSEPGALRERREPRRGFWEPALPDASPAVPTARHTSPAGLSLPRNQDLPSVSARPPVAGEAEAARPQVASSGEGEPPFAADPERRPAARARPPRPAWTALVEAGRAVDRGFTRAGSTLARRFGRLGEAVASAF